VLTAVPPCAGGRENFINAFAQHFEQHGATVIEKVRKETVYATDVEKKKLLDRLARSKALAKDAWLERDTPANPTQFVQIQPMEAQSS